MDFSEFLVAVTIAALVGVVGNYCVLRRVSYLKEVDQLKRRYYEFMEMSTQYWRSNNLSTSKRKKLESAIIASQVIVSSEHRLIAKKLKRIKKSHENTNSLRILLWDAVSSGCFQQKNWKPDYDRAQLIIKYVLQIIKTFY